MEAKSPPVHRLKVDAAGRILLPAELRHRHGIHQGDEVVAEEDESGIRITTLQEAIRQAQDYFARLAPPDRRLSEELLRERRDEAARE
jgi:AbrB family looped-hinge helix DNA binding protein